MQPKISLLRSDNYAVIWGTNQIALLLSNFLSGRDHILEIGSEQGDIEIWDDIILKHKNNIIEHVQIKRQTSDFDSTGACIRDVLTKDINKGKLRKLTPFDETMKALAEYYLPIISSGEADYKKFKLVLPDNSVKIKKDFTVRDFKNFCSVIKENSTPEGLCEMQKKDNNILKSFHWLTTWCGFTDWNHILMAFKKLEPLIVGEEIDLENSTKQNLDPYFIDFPTVRGVIENLFRNNSTAPNSLTPRFLLNQLSGYLKPEIDKWTQYSRKSNSWMKSGIHDTNDIESPQVIVNGLWNENASSILKVHIDNSLELCSISTALLRLAIHFTGGNRLQAVGTNSLKISVTNHVGGTLGSHVNDCNNLPFLEYTPFENLSGCNLASFLDQEKEAEKLHQEMNNLTFQKVADLVIKKIIVIGSVEIKEAAIKRWEIWKEEIDFNVLCTQMMRPQIEGESIEVRFRIGPKTAHILAHGIFFLLVVSLGYDPYDNRFELINEKKIISNALEWWSGPSRQSRRVRSMSDTDIVEMIKDEKGDCVVLSGTSSSLSEIYETSLAEDFLESQDLTKTLRSKIIFTNSFKIKRELKSGNLESLHKLIKNDIDNHLNNIDKIIENI